MRYVLYFQELFSLGGDEIMEKWNANPKIQKFKQENQMVSNHDLQTYFNTVDSDAKKTQ
jgi:hexosaminidase